WPAHAVGRTCIAVCSAHAGVLDLGATLGAARLLADPCESSAAVRGVVGACRLVGRTRDGDAARFVPDRDADLSRDHADLGALVGGGAGAFAIRIIAAYSRRDLA